MKFPVPREDVPKLDLNPRTKDLLCKEANKIVKRTIEKYFTFVNDLNRNVDRSQWKQINQHQDIITYTDRGLYVSRGDADSIRRLLIFSVGTVEGKMEDILFGSMVHTPSVYRIQQEYFQDSIDTEVLNQLIMPTEERPFHALTVNWCVCDRGNEFVNKFIHHRDLCTMNYTGIAELASGERIGYHLYHTPTRPEVPLLPRKYKVIRSSVSITTIYRQISAGRLEVFRTGWYEPGGRASTSFLNRLVITNGHETVVKGIDFARMKKLRWSMKSSQRTLPNHSLDFCHLCQSHLQNTSRNICRICEAHVCIMCRKEEQICFLSPKTGLTFTKTLSFCLACYDEANQLSSIDLALKELSALGGPMNQKTSDRTAMNLRKQLSQSMSQSHSSLEGSQDDDEASYTLDQPEDEDPNALPFDSELHRQQLVFIVGVVTTLIVLSVYAPHLDQLQVPQRSSLSISSMSEVKSMRSVKSIKEEGNQTSDGQKTLSSEFSFNGDEQEVTKTPLTMWDDDVLMQNRVDAGEIKHISLLRKGETKLIYLATYMTNTIVVKKLRTDKINEENTKKFVAEIKLMCRLNHPKICLFLGVAWTVETDMSMLLECMSGFELRSYLDSVPKEQRKWTNQKISIAIDIAEALVYLHCLEPQVLHRDLKARNVLLDNEMRAKLSEFGVSKENYVSRESTTIIADHWTAPEVITGNSNYTVASDIYSFGIILYELHSHAQPFADVAIVGGNTAANDAEILRLVSIGKLRPHFSRDCPKDIRDIAMAATSFDPNSRPTALKIAFGLRTLLKSMADIDQVEQPIIYI